MKTRRHWLMKTEPDVFSFEDLSRAKNQTTSWEGVRNFQARNLMRDDFKVGDRAFIYHSGGAEPHIAGVAEVVRGGYEDKNALDPNSKYYDPKAKSLKDPWIMVDVKATHRFRRPVTRELLKKEPRLQKMMVLQKGARLSVQPVSAEEFDLIVKMGQPEAI